MAKKKSGAKGKYHEWITPEGLLKLEGWARDGDTDDTIATKMGVAAGTLYRYKNEFNEINEALKKGKEVVDRQVENKLLKRALGYEYEEKEFLVYQMEDEEYYDEIERFIKIYKFEHPEATDAEIEYKRLTFPKDKRTLVKSKTKEVISDTTAQIFWLKNRMPDAWRDKQTIDHTGSMSINNPLTGLSEDELRRLANAQNSP